MHDAGVIDVWAQIVTPEMSAAPWMGTLLRWTGSTSVDAQASINRTLESMDAAGVELALLSAWYGPSGPLITNRQVASQIARSPDRFRGLASADIRYPASAARELRNWLALDEFVGVRIVPWLWDLPPNHRLYYPIYAACVEADVPICTQIGHTGPLCRSEPGRLIPYLDDVLLDFPDLKVVGGHVGYPWIDELTSLTYKYPNLYVDTSAYAIDRLPADFLEYMKGAGNGRVMFGSNWPMIGHGRCLEDLDRTGLSSKALSMFLAGTARQVFSLY